MSQAFSNAVKIRIYWFLCNYCTSESFSTVYAKPHCRLLQDTAQDIRPSGDVLEHVQTYNSSANDVPQLILVGRVRAFASPAIHSRTIRVAPANHDASVSACSEYDPTTDGTYPPYKSTKA